MVAAEIVSCGDVSGPWRVVSRIRRDPDGMTAVDVPAVPAMLVLGRYGFVEKLLAGRTHAPTRTPNGPSQSSTPALTRFGAPAVRR